MPGFRRTRLLFGYDENRVFDDRRNTLWLKPSPLESTYVSRGTLLLTLFSQSPGNWKICRTWTDNITRYESNLNFKRSIEKIISVCPPWSIIPHQPPPGMQDYEYTPMLHPARSVIETWLLVVYLLYCTQLWSCDTDIIFQCYNMDPIHPMGDQWLTTSNETRQRRHTLSC